MTQIGDTLVISINEINSLLDKILTLYIKSKEGRIVGSMSNSPLDTVYEEAELLLFQNEIGLLRTELLSKANSFPVVTLIPPSSLPDIII